MNARQKAKKYKKELNRLKNMTNPCKAQEIAVGSLNNPICKFRDTYSMKSYEYLLDYGDSVGRMLKDSLCHRIKDMVKVDFIRNDCGDVVCKAEIWVVEQ